jgi:putative CocE/NonD family hydrolase
VFHSGRLKAEEPGKSPADVYRYDPLDVRPAELERQKVDNVLTDQRYALNLFGNGLAYHSEPLPNETEVAGDLKFVAWIKLNVPDTDFQARVYEIQPDGTSIFLAGDRLRARYRESLREPKLVEPGKVVRYEFTGFPFFARVLKKGSRLRLVFHSPNSIYLEKNYNSGGTVETETAHDARTAEVTLYHDADRPSHLVLPVSRWR